jgi:hypothetical protein
MAFKSEISQAGEVKDPHQKKLLVGMHEIASEK